jgi:hypothetical protein
MLLVFEGESAQHFDVLEGFGIPRSDAGIGLEVATW